MQSCSLQVADLVACTAWPADSLRPAHTSVCPSEQAANNCVDTPLLFKHMVSAANSQNRDECVRGNSNSPVSQVLDMAHQYYTDIAVLSSAYDDDDDSMEDVYDMGQGAEIDEEVSQHGAERQSEVREDTVCVITDDAKYFLSNLPETMASGQCIEAQTESTRVRVTFNTKGYATTGNLSLSASTGL